MTMSTEKSKLYDIIARIKSEKCLKTDAGVANLLGIQRTALAERKSRNSIPYEELVTFCDRENYSLDWLFTSEGPKYREERKEAKGSVSLNLSLVGEVIEVVEALFQREHLQLPPKKKAELITLLYEELLEDESKKDRLEGRILRLVKLAV